MPSARRALPGTATTFSYVSSQDAVWSKGSSRRASSLTAPLPPPRLPCSLYERSGYRVDGSWVDPDWLRSAERGQVGVKRRRLLVKRL